jgi:hypothetical protein
MNIDRKFTITATAVGSGKRYTEENAVLFLAKDRAFLLTLQDYIKHCRALGAAPEQIQAAQLLFERVRQYQATHETKVPDVDPVKEASALSEV